MIKVLKENMRKAVNRVMTRIQVGDIPMIELQILSGCTVRVRIILKIE